MLTKTNYVEWSQVMKVKMEARYMWEVVQYVDAIFEDNRRAVEAIIASVLAELESSIAKDAWDSIAAARIGGDHASRGMLQRLRKE